MKIQSISNLITNSSTEVFLTYSSRTAKDIRNLVTSILSLVDPSKTFDDYFNSSYINNAIQWCGEEPLSFEDWAKRYYDCDPEEMKKIFFIDLDHSRYATINFIEENFEVLEHENC